MCALGAQHNHVVGVERTARQPDAAKGRCLNKQLERQLLNCNICLRMHGRADGVFFRLVLYACRLVPRRC